MPKGVILTHKQIIKSGKTFLTIFDPKDHNPYEHRYIGYLPLAHILELETEIILFALGVNVGYSSPYTLTDSGTAIRPGDQGDANLFHPTIMAGVPLMLDRIRKGIYDKLEKRGILAKELFNFAINYKGFWKSRGKQYKY